MLTFLIRRLMAALVVLLLVLVIIFVAVRLIPGDPAVMLLGPGATTQQIMALRTQLHLDEPPVLQFRDYVVGLAHGDLGCSLRTGQPILRELTQRLPATMELALTALVFALLLGLPLGSLSAVWANSAFDHVTRVISLIGVSAPAFWLAMLLQVVFAIFLHLLPVSGRLDPLFRPNTITGLLLVDALVLRQPSLFWNALQHLILPASVLAAFLGATIARFLRGSMLEVLREDYVRTATAKGLSRRTVIGVHVLRNSLLPSVTILGLKFAELLGGAILTETVFSWPGMGRYMYEAILARDYPVIQGGTLFFALVFMLSALVVDMLYGVLDPRIRVEA